MKTRLALLKTLAQLVIAFLTASVSNAQTFGSASTYSGLTWSVSTSIPDLFYCNQLLLDATGDFYNSTNYVVYGALNCPALGSGYASSGNAYFGIDGSFNMTVSIGVGVKLVCVNLSGATLGGSCAIFNALGAQLGTAFVSFP